MEFRVSRGPLLGHSLGSSKNAEKDDGKSHSRQRGDLLREEINKAQSKQSYRYQAQTQGDLQVTHLQVQGNAKFPLAGLLVTKHKHGKALHGEAPHHTESVCLAQYEDVSSAEENGEELEPHH